MHKADRACVLHGLRNGHDDGLCALAPQVINYDVDTVSELSHQRFLKMLRSPRMGRAQREWDREVCSQRQQFLKLAFIAACANDFTCAEMLCKLNREPARSSCCAIDQDCFVRLQASAFHQGGPRRHAGIGDSRRGHAVEAVWNENALPGINGGFLSKRSVRSFRQGEVYPPP